MKKIIYILFSILLTIQVSKGKVDSTVTTYDFTTIGVYQLSHPKIAAELLKGKEILLDSSVTKVKYQDGLNDVFDLINKKKLFVYLTPEKRKIGYDSSNVVMLKTITDYGLISRSKRINNEIAGYSAIGVIFLLFTAAMYVSEKKPKNKK